MSSTLDSEILDSDILPRADWSHPDYIFENDESWTLSLKKCYNKFPEEQVTESLRFVYDHDTTDEIRVKTAAAEKAFVYFMEKYDSCQIEHPNPERHREMIHSRANLFFCCLRTYHPLTIHYKCKISRDIIRLKRYTDVLLAEALLNGELFMD